ncbi:sugar ABC transporter permease [Fodinisporobacter ferrooxydans]|uniref:Sugar ABC transporter permease n=1 Tax=Fodinisporobacter ferrooxydans TaxID=2901836 RepID=A0ABY4CN20_9BACL|nr:sugar ABC transporter permease [Alicyclobacillaceae bacterium MYW30-H2]
MSTGAKKRWSFEKVAPVLFLLPSIIAIGIFVYGFIGWTAYASLSAWNSIVPDFTFVGLKNYIFLFHDFRFQSDLRNTLFFTIFFIGISIVIGLGLAILIDQKIKGETFFRNIFIFPMALSLVVTGVVWQWLLNPSTGVNLILKKLGVVHLPKWFVDTTVIPKIHWGVISFGIPVAILAVVIAAVWQMSGFTMAMYLSSLRAIPDELKEAARIDGATELQIYRKIILPLMWPVTLSTTIILAHISLKIFDLIYTMTGPGAGFVTDVPGVYMFETTFRGNHYAQGTAIAVIMLIFISLIIVPYLVSSSRKEAE